MKILTMAWRNIWRSTRRTAVTLAAMTLALVAMALANGMMRGYVDYMLDRVVEVEVGDLQIFASDYQNRPSIYERIDEPAQLIRALEQRGYRASSRLLGGALIAAGTESSGVSLRGVDLDQDTSVSRIGQELEHGSWLSADDPHGLVLGRKLARTLNVGIGDELIVLSQATDGSMANDLFTVRGILSTTGEATDRGGAFILADQFRAFYSLSDGAHQLLVRRPEAIDLGAATEEVASLAPDLDVRNWKQLMPTVASLVDSAETSIMIVTLIMYVVIGILILNATLTAVFERVREFGVLKAIGVSPGNVVRLILTETMLTLLLAGAIAAVIAAPALWYLSSVGIDTGGIAGTGMGGMTFMPHWYAIVTPRGLLTPLTLMLIIVFLGALFPAIKAARILPVEAMRYQ